MLNNFKCIFVNKKEVVGCFDKIEARVKGVNKIFGEFTNNDKKI